MKSRCWSKRKLKKTRWKRSLARALKRGDRLYGGFIELTDEMIQK